MRFDFEVCCMPTGAAALSVPYFAIFNLPIVNTRELCIESPLKVCEFKNQLNPKHLLPSRSQHYKNTGNQPIHQASNSKDQKLRSYFHNLSRPSGHY